MKKTIMAVILFSGGYLLAMIADRRGPVGEQYSESISLLNQESDTNAKSKPFHNRLRPKLAVDPNLSESLDPNEIVAPYCEKEDGCGLAKACIDNKCQPCTQDNDCASTEICVRENCLLVENVECFKNEDCEGGDCALSGYSFGVRSNKDMKAFCRASFGGEPQVVDLAVEKKFELSRGPRMQPDNSFSDLRKGLKHVQNSSEP